MDNVLDAIFGSSSAEPAAPTDSPQKSETKDQPVKAAPAQAPRPSHGGKSNKHIAIARPAGKAPPAMRRHRRVLRDNIKGITNPGIRRIARRAGCKRIAGDLYEHNRQWLRQWLTRVIGNAVTYAEHARRVTVTKDDLILALRRTGITFYSDIE